MKFSVVLPSQARLDAVVKALEEGRVATGISATLSAQCDLAIASSDRAPDVLITAVEPGNSEALAILGRIGYLNPAISVILLSDHHTSEFLLEAMRAGVREVLPGAPSEEALLQAVDRIRRKREPPHPGLGKVLVFISCKGGGGGATFLAANLAYALAAIENKKVIVIDLNLQWGDVVFFVSEKAPAGTLADIATQINRVDAAFLASSLVNIHPNLGILASPEDPVRSLEIKPEHVDVLLKIARANYDFVILDAGRSLDAITVRALDHADMIFPVMQKSLPFIRDGKRLLKAFRSLEYPAERIRPVVNRYERAGEIQLTTMEESLGCKIYRTFPNDYDVVTASINQGVPVVKLSRRSAIARSLCEFAHELTVEPGVVNGGWLRRITGHG